MRLLLDTHFFLWAVAGSRSLSSTARRRIADAERVFVSAVSIWEVAIRARLGKIDADAEALTAAIEASGFVELPVHAVHAAAVQRLPWHHADPLDRLQLAQAITEPLRLLTADPARSAYGAFVERA